MSVCATSTTPVWYLRVAMMGEIMTQPSWPLAGWLAGGLFSHWATRKRCAGLLLRADGLWGCLDIQDQSIALARLFAVHVSGSGFANSCRTLDENLCPAREQRRRLASSTGRPPSSERGPTSLALPRPDLGVAELSFFGCAFWILARSSSLLSCAGIKPTAKTPCSHLH